jgi:hypothetical protein
MGQILHGCATTTEAVRRAIQHSQESLRTLSKRFGINQKTVAKWRKRSSVADLPTGRDCPEFRVWFGHNGKRGAIHGPTQGTQDPGCYS